MFLTGLKRYCIQKKINTEYKKNVVISNISDKRIKSILVFVDENHSIDISEIIKNRLSIDGLKIDKLIFKERNERESIQNESVSSTDFNLFGNIRNEWIRKIKESDYDLLLNYCNNNLFSNYLTVLSRAKFKVGRSLVDNRIFNFMISVGENDIETFNNELVKYLKILNKI